MKIKKLRIILLTLLFGTVGLYFIVNSFAASICEGDDDPSQCPPPLTMVANPPLAAGCGYDIALLGDSSDSMQTNYMDMRNDMKSLVNALQGTNSQFAVGGLGPLGSMAGFSGDTATVRSNIDTARFTAGSFRDLRIVNQMDKRSNRQNLIILFTDMFNKINVDTSAHLVKQSGTRVVILRYAVAQSFGDPRDSYTKEAEAYLAGPLSYSGGSVTVNGTIEGQISTYISALAAHAKQPCSPPPPSPGPGPNPGTNPGPGNGNGTGTGNGSGSGGSGTGTNGSGQGQSPGTGTGGGGGGSTSNKPDDKPNPLPSPTGQGDTNKQPEVEPSPFFDGKLFAIGSDVDSEDIRGVSIAGRTFGWGWLYLLGLLLLVAALLATYLFWWRKMSEAKRDEWKRKLRLG